MTWRQVLIQLLYTWSTQRKLLASESGTQPSALNREQPNVKPDVAACLYPQTYCSFNSLHSGCFNCNGCFLSCWRLFHLPPFNCYALALRPCRFACHLSIQLMPSALRLEWYAHTSFLEPLDEDDSTLNQCTSPSIQFLLTRIGCNIWFVGNSIQLSSCYSCSWLVPNHSREIDIPINLVQV